LGYQGPWSDGASVEEVTSSQREIRTSGRLQAAIAALYDGEVRNADKAVKLLLDGLADRNVLQNAIVVLVADHGEALGENGRFGHGPILWETVVRTPLAIVDYRDPAHRIVDSTVGTVDLMATLLEIVGQEPGPGPGRSLVPALKGNALDTAEYLVEVEMRKEDRRPSWYDADRLAVYYDEFKLEYSFGKGQLFDLRHDSEAVQPVDPGRPSYEFDRTIGDYLEGVAEEYVASGMAANLSTLDGDAVNQLRSLGYVQ
jgi:arylsulfatase A-like enzyme